MKERRKKGEDEGFRPLRSICDGEKGRSSSPAGRSMELQRCRGKGTKTKLKERQRQGGKAHDFTLLILFI